MIMIMIMIIILAILIFITGVDKVAQGERLKIVQGLLEEIYGMLIGLNDLLCGVQQILCGAEHEILYGIRVRGGKRTGSSNSTQTRTSTLRLRFCTCCVGCLWIGVGLLTAQIIGAVTDVAGGQATGQLVRMRQRGANYVAGNTNGRIACRNSRYKCGWTTRGGGRWRWIAGTTEHRVAGHLVALDAQSSHALFRYGGQITLDATTARRFVLTLLHQLLQIHNVHVASDEYAAGFVALLEGLLNVLAGAIVVLPPTCAVSSLNGDSLVA